MTETVHRARKHTHHPFSGSRQDHGTGRGCNSTTDRDYGTYAANHHRVIRDNLHLSLAGASPDKLTAAADAILAAAGCEDLILDEDQAWWKWAFSESDLTFDDEAFVAAEEYETLTLLAQCGDEAARRRLAILVTEADGWAFAQLEELGLQRENPFRRETFLDPRDPFDQIDRNGEGLVGISIRTITAEHVR